jgi:putative membrane protein
MSHTGGWPALPFLAGLLLYGVAVLVCVRRGRSWPYHRSLLWVAGLMSCLAAVVGPLATWADASFQAHMIAHLLLGMLGPLLLVRAAPVTLALRALDVRSAQLLARVLGSRSVRWLSHPVVAGVGDLGGLWLLYTTHLYAFSQSHPVVHVLVHVHMLLFGYLFTAALVGIDPDRHRRGPLFRAVVLMLFMAGHSILGKVVYAWPTPGVTVHDAETGAMIMYYGGDVVDLVIAVILFHRWYVLSGRSLPARRVEVGSGAGRRGVI